ncbi:hypothetical protein AAVH_35748, partial [Aphelenchoides avenae]
VAYARSHIAKRLRTAASAGLCSRPRLGVPWLTGGRRGRYFCGGETARTAATIPSTTTSSGTWRRCPVARPTSR